MNKLPDLPYSDQITRAVQKSFGGYQHSAGSYDGNIYDMVNLSSDHYPLLATREKRKYVKTASSFNGCVAVGDTLCYVDGTFLYKEGNVVGTVADSEKTFAVLGDRLLIFPDKKYLNLAALGRYATVDALTAAVSLPDYGDVYAVGVSAPYALYYWTGTEWSFHEYEMGPMNPQFRGSVVFKAKGTLYDEDAVDNGIYAAAVNWSDYFRKGDAVTISGCVIHTENNKTPIIREIAGSFLYFYEHVFTVDTLWRYTARSTLAAGSYYFTVHGSSYCFTLPSDLAVGATLTWDQTALVLDSTNTTIAAAEGAVGTALTLTATEIDYSEAAVTIEREVPALDHLCAAYNRLWGCQGDTVFASKLGDPFNFNVFDGLSTDSYTVKTGSPGSFTGCCCYLGYPTFFKEDVIYKIYGSAPSNFEAISAFTVGVAKNCHKSLAVAGEMLFYLSRAGVVSYSGGVPVFLRSAFGNVSYHNGVAGSNGSKYFISMADPDGIFHLFVYDTTTGLWHKEDHQELKGFYYLDHHLMMVDSKGVFMTADGNAATMAGTEEETVAWMAEFGDFIENSPDKKAVTKLLIRLDLEADAMAEIFIEYDGGNYGKVGKTLTGEKKRSWYLPLMPSRCDYFRIKIAGQGGCQIHSLAVEYSTGSAL